MHAVLVDGKQKLVWTEVPDPVPRAGELVIDVHAAAVNRADLLQRAGNYPPPPGWPEWMGLEVAGVVVEAPAESRWKAGDKVCALLGGGGYAERVAVPVEMVVPVPEGLSMVEAAAIPEAFATSYLNLCIEGGMKKGETVRRKDGNRGTMDRDRDAGWSDDRNQYERVFQARHQAHRQHPQKPSARDESTDPCRP